MTATTAATAGNARVGNGLAIHRAFLYLNEKGRATGGFTVCGSEGRTPGSSTLFPTEQPITCKRCLSKPAPEQPAEAPAAEEAAEPAAEPAEQRSASLHPFYLHGTIHLAATADAADRYDSALCLQLLIGAIDTQAAATCPGCLRRAAELDESDALDAMRDAEAAANALLLADWRAAADPGAGIAIDSEPQPAEEQAAAQPEPECRYCRYTAGHTSWCPDRAPEPLGERQSPLHQRAIIEALPMPPGEGGEPVRATIWEADLATRQGEPRELIGCDARDLRAGDIIVSAGCEHRDFRGCQHRLYAAFDLLLQDGEAGERITIWTAIADQEAGQPPRLTMPAGRRLLVQRRLPDWKIAEAPSFAASIIDLAMPELPPLCGPAGNLARGGDLNSDWTCRRARALWGAHRRAAELQEECARLDRMRSERRRRGLGDWIARAFVRYEALDRRLLRELPPCGHPEGLRREMSVEEALPACTC